MSKKWKDIYIINPYISIRMISSFLKKLLFARQFFMIDGKIEILGKKQVMMPTNVLAELQKLNTQTTYSAVKSVIRKDVEDYAKKLGSGEQGMLKNINYIFETFGLGKLEIMDINNKKKKCIIRIHNSPLMDLKKKEKPVYNITPAIISGMFSFLFDKEVDAKLVKHSVGSLSYNEYSIG